jgi:probable F420-dependent oxidoreductase
VDLGPAEYRTIARAAEDAGFNSLAFSEHVVMPVDLLPQMGAHWPDAFTAMAFIAGATERIRVDSSVVVLPYHPPIQFAKAVATLDALSGGRVSLTVGAGMARDEFAALGIPFEMRGRITDEYIRAMRVLWTEDEPAFEGEFVSFRDVVFEPKPVQHPHPPIFVGGRSIFALRRAARLGDGWSPAGAQGGRGPWIEGPQDLPRFLEEARRIEGFAEKEAHFGIHMPPVPANLGRDHQVVGDAVPVTSTQQVLDMIGSLAAAGVTGTSVPPLDPGPRSLAEHLEYLDWAGAEVMPHFPTTP